MSKAEEVASVSVTTSHVMHNFQEHRMRVCFILSACFQPTRPSKKRKKVNKERERETAYLLTEDQLVIKEEEDSLLAASIRLIDP